MVRRLLAAGHEVTVAPRGGGLAEVQAAGARVASGPADLASGCAVLVVCVFTDAQVREALLGGGALAAMPTGSVVVIHTTGSPALAQELGAAAPQGVDVLDATFSGGPAEIAAGTLTVMAGGADTAFRQALPILSAYAKHVHHVGQLGQGQTIKLLNNLLFATNLRNAAETLRLAEQHGLEAAAAAQILHGCSADSFAMSRFTSPRPVAATLAALRPYLEKDVAAAARNAADAGLDLTPFAPTIAYFQSGEDRQ